MRAFGTNSPGRTMKTIPALAAMALALALPAAAGAATVGTTTVHPPVATNGAGVAQVYGFTAPSSGQVDRLNVYLDETNTASRVEVGLYSGSSSGAGTQRARCVIEAPTAGAWNRCSISSSAVTSGAYYWLALLQPAGSTGSLQYREGQVFAGPLT